jgi:hypothetical protein
MSQVFQDLYEDAPHEYILYPGMKVKLYLRYISVETLIVNFISELINAVKLNFFE